MASQNIYDDEDFFNRYSQFSIAKNGIEQVYEWPYIKSLLPNALGLKVLDLGCGVGSFSRESIKNGASYVLGIDISHKMIYKAKELSKECENIDIDKRLKYEIQDLESLKLDSNIKFDLVFSRFTFHYIVNLESLFSTIYSSLIDGGTFLFTVEHPFKTCSKTFSGLIDVNDNDVIKKVWPVSDYSDEGERVRSWLGVDGIVKQHRTISTYINILIKCGFTIEHVNEKSPTKEQLETFGTNNDLDRIFILIIKVSKKLNGYIN